jgi:hypothetical protein
MTERLGRTWWLNQRLDKQLQVLFEQLLDEVRVEVTIVMTIQVAKDAPV